MSDRFEFSRSDRVRKALMREVSDIIRRDIKDPRLSGEVISITDVEVSGDLRHAKIYVSVYGTPEVQEAMMTILQDATKRVRSEIGKRVRLQFTPEIQFYADESLERGSRVSKLLDQISREQGPSSNIVDEEP
jgi:ribosome-binding factor A